MSRVLKEAYKRWEEDQEVVDKAVQAMTAFFELTTQPSRDLFWSIVAPVIDEELKYSALLYKYKLADFFPINVGDRIYMPIKGINERLDEIHAEVIENYLELHTDEDIEAEYKMNQMEHAA